MSESSWEPSDADTETDTESLPPPRSTTKRPRPAACSDSSYTDELEEASEQEGGASEELDEESEGACESQSPSVQTCTRSSSKRRRVRHVTHVFSVFVVRICVTVRSSSADTLPAGMVHVCLERVGRHGAVRR